MTVLQVLKPWDKRISDFVRTEFSKGGRVSYGERTYNGI